jgi:hypothetical protein
MKSNGEPTDLHDLLDHILVRAKEGMSDVEISYSITGSLSVTPVTDLIALVRKLAEENR